MNQGLAGALTSARPSGQMTNLAGQFTGHARHAEGTRNRLYSIMERLRGAVPTPATTPADLSKASREPPIRDKLAQASEDLERTFGEINSMLDDLDALI